MCRSLSGLFDSAHFAIDPNLSYWLLRLVINSDRNQHKCLIENIGDEFRSHALSIAEEITGNGFPAWKIAEAMKAKVQMMYTKEEDIWELEGVCLLKTLSHLLLDTEQSGPLEASRMLSTFLGRSVYFETTLTNRPRLCAEVGTLQRTSEQ